MTDQGWAGKTSGNGWMHKWLINTLKVIDVSFIYVFAFVFVVPGYLCFTKYTGIIYAFFRKRIGYGKIKSAWKTVVNFCRFAQVVIDKFAMYAGKRFKVEVDGLNYFSHLEKQKESFLMLSAHVGNYELAGYSLVSKQKPINALVFMDEKQSIRFNRSKMFKRTNVRVIPVQANMEHIFEINRVIEDGEIISIPADRVWGSSRTLTVNFLGAEAKIPLGPFNIAVMKQVNVLAVNVVKTGWKKYKIFVKPLDYDKNIKRNEQAKQLANLYANQLEDIVRNYPVQWFNYFDFWK